MARDFCFHPSGGLSIGHVNEGRSKSVVRDVIGVGELEPPLRRHSCYTNPH
jgi:hypothetical protein